MKSVLEPLFSEGEAYESFDAFYISQQSPVHSIAFSPDGRTLASGSWGSIQLFDTQTHQPIASFEAHKRRVNSVAFSPDGRTLASGSNDGSVKLFDTQSHQPIASFEAHKSRVPSVAFFSPDGRTLASGLWDGSIQLFDTQSHQPIASFKAHKRPVNSIAFSPDGRTLASGSDDGSVKLFDTQSHQPIASFKAHKDSVHSVAFSPDGRTLASGADDASVMLWELPKRSGFLGWFRKRYRKPAKTLRYTSGVNAVAFSPLGELIVGLKSGVIEGERYRYIGGVRGCWVVFDKAHKRLYRGDDGTLLLDRTHRFVAPKGFSRDIVAHFPPSLALSHQQSTPIKVEIENRGAKEAYLTKIFCSSPLVILYANMLYKIAPHTRTTLELKLSLNVFKNQNRPYQERVGFDIRSNDKRVAHRELLVDVLSPKIEVLSVEQNESTLLITLINRGNEAIEDAAIKLFDEVQTIPKLGINETVQKAFVVHKALSLCSFRVYKEGLPRFEWAFTQKVTQQSARVRAILQEPLKLYGYAWEEFAQIKAEFAQANREPPIDIDAWIAFAKASDKIKYLASKLEASITKEGAYYRLQMPSHFLIDNFLVYLYDDEGLGALKNDSKLLLICSTPALQDRVSKLCKNRTDLRIAPSYQELLELLVAKEPLYKLGDIFSNYLNLRDISPYTTSSGVGERQFVGREDILAKILNRQARNYFILGARQIGKSSLLGAIERGYQRANVEVHHITLGDTKADVLQEISAHLHIEKSMEALKHYIYKESRVVIFLLDEVDKFIVRDKQNGYYYTEFFRKFSQEGRAYFIMAGFWELFFVVTQKYDAPIRNFGEVIELEELEKEACEKLVREPMQSIGVAYEEAQSIQRIIQQSGQRANLIALISDALLEEIQNKTITPQNVEEIFDGDGLNKYLNESFVEDKLDRLIIFATLGMESFSFGELLDRFDDIDVQTLQESLDRLKLYFILKYQKGRYSYRVPLFVNKTVEKYGDVEKVFNKEYAQYKKV